MRIRKRNSGSVATPALLSLILVIFVGVTVYVFASNLPWAVRPAPITSVGAEIDHQYDLTLAVAGTVFILSQLGLAFACSSSRDRGQKAHFTRGSNTLEAIWTTATIVLFLGLGLMATKPGRKCASLRQLPTRFKVEVTGNHSFSISAIPAPMENSAGSIPNRSALPPGNPLGIDANDPGAKTTS